MPATYRRKAFGRIGLVINANEPQRPQNPGLAANYEGLKGYPALHLIIHDWIVWQHLPPNEQDFLIHTWAVEQTELMASRAFTRLVRQYKRAGLVWLERWKQAPGESSLNQ